MQTRLVIYIISGVLVVGILGLSIAGLAGAFTAAPRDVCGHFTEAGGKVHKFFVDVNRTSFESMVDGEFFPSVLTWTRVEGEVVKFKSGSVEVEVKKNKLILDKSMQAELFASCETTRKEIADFKANMSKTMPKCGSFQNKYHYWAFVNGTTEVFEAKEVKDFTLYRRAQSSPSLPTSSLVEEDCDLHTLEKLVHLNKTVKCENKDVVLKDVFYSPDYAVVQREDGRLFRLEEDACKRIEAEHGVWTNKNTVTFWHMSELTFLNKQKITAISIQESSVKAEVVAEISKEGIINYLVSNYQDMVRLLLDANDETLNFRMESIAWNKDLVNRLAPVARAACANDQDTFVTNANLVKAVVADAAAIKDFEKLNCQYLCAAVMVEDKLYWISKYDEKSVQVIEDVKRPFYTVPKIKKSLGELTLSKIKVSSGKTFSATQSDMLVVNIASSECARIRKMTAEVTRRFTSIKCENLDDITDLAVKVSENEVLVKDKIYTVSDKVCTLKQ